MDRRKSLKLIATGVIAVPAVVAGCNTTDKTDKPKEHKFDLDRNPDELKYENKLLNQEAFFTSEEMATITVLADIIIPRDEVSGSASDAKVPEFIAFIVQDMPQHQIPLKGGLRWLDLQCLHRYGKGFKDCAASQQLELVDLIAYPEKVKEDRILSQGASFFSLMRNLTITGFYTSKIGVADIGYIGNTPTKWNGVPEDVLKQYGLSYTEKEEQECVKF